MSFLYLVVTLLKRIIREKKSNNINVLLGISS